MQVDLKIKFLSQVNFSLPFLPIKTTQVISTPSLILTGPCCFICGFAIKSGESFQLQSSPPKDVESDAVDEDSSTAVATLSKNAFFPFLASWDSPVGENGGKVKEDGSVTVCQ